MADRKIYFATDIHGSEVCLRKFLNAGKFYGCDTLIMGGDITGKMIVPIVDRGLQTEQVAAELIFLGAGWPPVLRALADHLVIDDRDLAHTTVCADPDQAIAHIAAKQRGDQRTAGQPRG
jgi:hypothetical protein